MKFIAEMRLEIDADDLQQAENAADAFREGVQSGDGPSLHIDNVRPMEGEDE